MPKVSILAERGAQSISGHQVTTTNNGRWDHKVLRVRGDKGHPKVTTVTQKERQSVLGGLNNNIY